jgi:hypothetical protein
MSSPNQALVLWLPVILTTLMGGCSTGSHATSVRALAPLSVADTNLRPSVGPNPPTSVAQTAGSCWNTISCCVQNHPLTSVQSCGAAPLEAAAVLKTLESLYAAANPGEEEAAAADVAEVGQAEDWTSIAELPEWKQLCIKSYYACKDRGWTGKCDDCLRYCEGQQEWPTSRCGPRRKKQ